MNKKLQDGRFRIVSSLLAFCLLIGVVAASAATYDFMETNKVKTSDSGTLEKMIVANGNVSMDIDLNLLNGAGASARKTTLSFDAVRDTFFSVLVLNGEFRGPVPSSMEITPRGTAHVPASLAASYRNLVVEYLPWGGNYEMAVRDKSTGFTFFNIEGQEYDFDANHVLTIKGARLLISPEFAAQLGRTDDANTVVGTLSTSTSMRTVEQVELNDGEATQTVLPPMNRPEAGSRPGPDVVVGDLSGLAQFGSSSGTQVGLAVGTDSCNFGTVDLDWFANPQNDHPVIPQNLYRMSVNADRFEQIGQSNVKHAFTALTNNICNLGCNGVGGAHLGSGCSDPYGASLNSGPSLGSRAFINPFTGFYPRNDVADPNMQNNNHSGHAHTGPSHRILVEMADLSTASNPTGTTYFTEAVYITPHEYQWCSTHPGECNMYNNASYRQYSVSGTTSFSFAAVGATVREKPAIEAWTGATHVPIEPERGIDGIAQVAYKVTQVSANLWHYEYAIYNQNLDRGIQSFSVPIGTGVTVTNMGQHQPPQQPGWSADGTSGNSGFSSTAWSQTLSPGMMNWSTETSLANLNANAIRWGTLYNFRFDADKPPAQMFATVGFFKTGSPVNVLVQGPRSGIPSPCARVISAGSNPCASSAN
jgi:hypothetical protein